MRYVTPDEIERRFGFHPATPDVVPTYQAIRSAFRDLAAGILESTPGGREQDHALTALQEAQMWAIAAVATNLTPLGEEGTGYRPVARGCCHDTAGSPHTIRIDQTPHYTHDEGATQEG